MAFGWLNMGQSLTGLSVATCSLQLVRLLHDFPAIFAPTLTMLFYRVKHHNYQVLRTD